jgi:hypothetical protein
MFVDLACCLRGEGKCGEGWQESRGSGCSCIVGGMKEGLKPRTVIKKCSDRKGIEGREKKM